MKLIHQKSQSEARYQNEDDWNDDRDFMESIGYELHEIDQKVFEIDCDRKNFLILTGGRSGVTIYPDKND